MRSVFVGRAAHLQMVREAVALNRPIVLVGEAGAGKTTLVRRALRGSTSTPDRSSRGQVVRSAGLGRAGRRQFEGGALSMMVWREYFALERALGRQVNGVDVAAVATDVQITVHDGVLVLEDLQWAGPATLEVVEALAGRLALVTTVRSGDPGAPSVLERLGAAGFIEIEVGPLDPTAAAELVRANRPGLAEAAVASLVRRSGGNPLLLTELGSDGTASSGLRRSVAARLRDLDPDARETFLLIALAGVPLREELLNPAGVKALRMVNLLAEDEAGYLSPRHALLGEVAVETLADADRIRAHTALAHLVDGPGEAARHYAAAGDRELAHRNACRAADEASTPGERAGHLRLAASTSDGPGADELRLAAGRALSEGYDWQGVESVLAGLDRPDVDPELRATAWLLRARGAWGRGAAQDIAPAIEAGLAACAGLDSDTEVMLRIEATRVTLFVDYNVQAGLGLAKTGLDLALDRGVGVARARYFHGTAAAMLGIPSGFTDLALAVDAAFAEADYDTGFTAANNLISFHESDGDHSVGRALAEQMRAQAHALGFGVWETSMRYQVTQLDFHDGRCAELVPQAQDLLRLPIDARTRDSVREVLCMALIDLGSVEEAERLAETAMAEAVADQQGANQFLWVKGEAALCGARPADALRFMDDFLTGPDDDPNLMFGRVTRAWARFGMKLDPGPAPETSPRRMLMGVGPEIEGVRALHQQRYSEAVDLFDAAASAWYRYHRRGWVRCSWARGEALRLAGDVDTAIVALREAESRADELSFVVHAAWARHSLRQVGERRSAARAPSSTGLTAREAQVLALVANGLTNAQIAVRLSISPRTVITQIETASRRLGATGRNHAAALFRSLEGAGGPADAAGS